MQTQLVFFSRDAILPFLLVYVTTVLLSGLFPALQILRQDALIAFHGNRKSGQSSAYLRNSLVFLQLLVSFVLLAVALLIVRQTDYLLQRDTGVDAEQIMVVNAAGIPPDERIAFKHRLKENPSVANVSMCSTPPGESLFTFGLILPGRTADEDRRITFYHMFVDENLLETLGVDIHDGRFFDAGIPADSLNSFVVNQTGAEMIRDSVMTQQIEIPNIYTGKASKKSVIGIINDFHFTSFHSMVQPLILEYNPKYARYLLVRFHPRNTKAMIDNLDRTWKEMAPLLPLNYYFLDDSFANYYATEQRSKQIVMIVSWLAVCLAALGIFGTSLFAIQQRTREIGVRKLLGSATYGLFLLLFRPIFYIFFAACGVAVPIVIWAGEQWLARYPYRTDFPISILWISFMIILVVILITVSSYVFKIMRVQPAEVLKSQ
jgi:putative ABC transport system permease protein